MTTAPTRLTPAAPDASTSLLLSRVAESAYWSGRYLERAEGTARLVKAHGELMVDLPAHASIGWSPLLAVLGVGPDELPPAQLSEEVVMTHLLAASTNHSSVRSSIAAASRNLRVLRAVIPLEAAEVLNELQTDVELTADTAIERRHRGSFLTNVIRSCQILSASLADTMSHDEAFGFLTTGRQLERADVTTRVLEVHHRILTRRVDDRLEPYLDTCWFSVLRSVSALQAFRRSGRTSSAESTVSFLLRDPRCPRTVEACLIEASRRLLEIPGHEDAMAATAAVQRLLDAVDVAELVDGNLHEFVDEVQSRIAALHDAVVASWFAPQPAQAAR